MNEIEGFVLNGGRSSRMGVPKGSLRLGESTLASRAADALGAVCGTVYLVGGETAVDGIETLPDVEWHGSNKASILGLRSTLLHCSTKYAAVLACDMPFVTGEVFSVLAAERDSLYAGNSDVVLPADKSEWLQPLCAIYERDRCRVAIEAYLEAGDLSVRGFVGGMRCCLLDASRFATIRHADHLFMNVNTPEDIAEAAKMFR